MQHPHPDKQHVVRQIRRYLLAAKKSFSRQEKPKPGERIPRRGARSLYHYMDLVATYQEAKRILLESQRN